MHDEPVDVPSNELARGSKRSWQEAHTHPWRHRGFRGDKQSWPVSTNADQHYSPNGQQHGQYVKGGHGFFLPNGLYSQFL